MTKVKALIFFRIGFTILLLGSFLLLKLHPSPLPYHHMIKYLVLSIFILSFIYLLILPYIKNLKAFAYLQLIIDSLFIIALIFMTGGVESWFTFLMILNVIAGSIVIGRTGGFIIATILSLLYGLLIDLQFYKVIPLAFDPSLKVYHFLYNIFIHISSLYLVAYLSGYLTSRLQMTYQRLKSTEHDLSELRALNTIIVENVPSGIVTTNGEGKIIAFNSCAELITEIPRKEAIGKSIYDIFPFLRNSLETPELRIRTEGSIRVKGGEKFIGITINKLRHHDTSRSGGVTVGLIGVFQDLTEIKKAEEDAKRREKLAAIGELSRNIAHEIRNPLASLKGSIEILMEDRISPEQKKRLMEIALKEMERLNKIITDFLIYAKPSPLRIKNFNLIDLIDEVIFILRSSPKAEGVMIERDLSPELSGELTGEGMLISGDEAQLKQVFLNLGYNALEALENQPFAKRLNISIQREGEFVTVSFKDSGPGIREEDIDKIFYPFYSTKEDGSGLGLSIAYKIIEEHHGKISVRSSPEGTVFDVMIPMVAK